MALSNECWYCHRKDTLWFVNGKSWCNRCLFDEYYDFDKAVNYTIRNIDKFGDRYPDGLNWLWKWLKEDGVPVASTRLEEFVSENLGDYAEWVMTNPTIYPFEVIMEKVKEM